MAYQRLYYLHIEIGLLVSYSYYFQREQLCDFSLYHISAQSCRGAKRREEV